jgi:hypothetical protein
LFVCDVFIVVGLFVCLFLMCSLLLVCFFLCDVFVVVGLFVFDVFIVVGLLVSFDVFVVVGLFVAVDLFVSSCLLLVVFTMCCAFCFVVFALVGVSCVCCVLRVKDMEMPTTKVKHIDCCKKWCSAIFILTREFSTCFLNRLGKHGIKSLRSFTV